MRGAYTSRERRNQRYRDTKQIDIQREKHIYTDIQEYRQAGRQGRTHTDNQTGRHTGIHTHKHKEKGRYAKCQANGYSETAADDKYTDR